MKRKPLPIPYLLYESRTRFRTRSTSEVIGETTRAKQQKRECPYQLISKSMITETIFKKFSIVGRPLQKKE